MDERIYRYVDQGGWTTVYGACDPTTFAVFTDLDAIQRERGVQGDVAEIGVAAGRLLIMLGLLARPEECAIAIDVFEVDQNYDATGAGTTLDLVQNNFRSFVGESTELRLVIGDSMRLTPAALRPQTASGQIRLFSIDGAHSHFHTVNDMLLAEQMIPAGGVVTVDDIVNPGWPGVMEGVGRYFLNSACPRLYPFLMAYNKLWLTTYDHHQLYFEYALERAPMFSPGMLKRVTRFFGSDMVGF